MIYDEWICLKLEEQVFMIAIYNFKILWNWDKFKEEFVTYCWTNWSVYMKLSKCLVYLQQLFNRGSYFLYDKIRFISSVEFMFQFVTRFF